MQELNFVTPKGLLNMKAYKIPTGVKMEARLPEKEKFFLVELKKVSCAVQLLINGENVATFDKCKCNNFSYKIIEDPLYPAIDLWVDSETQKRSRGVIVEFYNNVLRCITFETDSDEYSRIYTLAKIEGRCVPPADGDVVYLCSPYSAPSKELIERHVRFARICANCIIENGLTPIVPHLYLPDILGGGDKQRNLAMKLDINLLKRCNAIIICTPGLSAGMKMEVEYAISNNIPVYSLSDFNCDVQAFWDQAR